MSNDALYARFIWREPSTQRPYDIEIIANIAFVPRVGELVEISAMPNSIHSFRFDDVFIVEEVKYRIQSGPSDSPDLKENWKTVAEEQIVSIYVRPRDKSGWSTVQRIKKEF